MRPRHLIPFCCAVIAISLAGPSVAQVADDPAALSSRLDSLDLLNQAATDILQEKSKLFSELEDDERSELLLEVETQIDERLQAAYRIPRLQPADAVALAGLHLDVLQRRFLGNKPVRTRVARLAERPECRVDLALGRYWSRYARAIARGDRGEAFLVLLEFQNGLNCLSGGEVRRLAEAFGIATWIWADTVDRGPRREALQRAATTAILNPALLLFDLSKYQGPTWLFFSLHRLQAFITPALSTIGEIYLYDFVSGNLVSFTPAGFVRLVDLLDPRHIGVGACSLLEMAGMAASVGDPTCRRGMECTSTAALTPAIGDLREAIGSRTRVEPRDLLDERRSTTGGSATGNSQTEALLGPKTPYGFHQRSLAGPCGSNAAAGGLEGLAAAPGFESFAGCLAESMAAVARDSNAGRCILEATIAGMEDETPVLVAGPGGVPVVVGVLGGSRCESHPLTRGPAGDFPISDDPEFECETTIECAKRDAADFYRSEAGEDFVEELLHDAAELRLFGEIGSPEAMGNPVLERAQQQASRHVERLVEKAIQAIEAAEEGWTFIKHGGAVGVTQNGDEITVQEMKGVPAGFAQSTLEHEAAHVVLNAFWRNSSQDEQHQVMQANEAVYVDRWLGLAYDALEAFAGLFETEAEENGDDPADPPGSPTQQPPGEDDYCSALSDSLKRVLSCTREIPGLSRTPFQLPGSESTRDLGPRFGRDFLTPRDEDASLPSQDPLASFAGCFERFGMSPLGIGSDGRLIVSGAPDLTSRQCGALDCTPPARAKPVGGTCRCVGPEVDRSLLWRDFGALRLCSTSDACTPREIFLDRFDTLVDRPILAPE